MDYAAGAKAGAVTNIIIQIMFILTSYSNTLSIAPEFASYLHIWSFTSIASSAVYGAFLGFLFCLIYDKIPGSSSIVKSYILGIIPYGMPVIGSLYIISLDSSFVFPETAIISNLIAYAMFGYLLGFLFDRLKKSQPKQTTGPPLEKRPS